MTVRLGAAHAFLAVLVVCVVALAFYWRIDSAYRAGKKDTERAMFIQREKEIAESHVLQGDMVIEQVRELSQSDAAKTRELQRNAEHVERVRTTRGDRADVVELSERFDAFGY